MEQKLEEAIIEALESSRIRYESAKYEERLKLIKKMHEEEVQEIRKVNKDREDHLEQQIVAFRKEKDKIFKQAKQEAAQEEKRKRAKFQLKVERIKRQEVAEVKR